MRSAMLSLQPCSYCCHHRLGCTSQYLAPASTVPGVCVCVCLRACACSPTIIGTAALWEIHAGRIYELYVSGKGVEVKASQMKRVTRRNSM